MIYASTETQTKLLENADIFQEALGEDSSENATLIIGDTFGDVVNSYDALKWITSMLMIGMIIAIIVSSFLTRTRPVFLIVYILLWLIAIIVSVPISNTYEELYLNPVLSSSFQGFWAQTYIFLNLPFWIAIIGAIAGIVMFVNMVKQSNYGGYV